MKAYQVRDKHEGCGEIVFATSSGRAKSKALGISFFHSDFIDIEAKRLPWADRFAENGKVPKKEMLTNGWIFECNGCFRFQNDETALIKDDEVYCDECYPNN